ncbi:peptidase [Favolaschia claudopus]|uniref:Peptide hydrolase n=1 Tax=Favolaschia claudopus TaxID=2862362 RepID=A0AAW0DR00_9AGAR
MKFLLTLIALVYIALAASTGGEQTPFTVDYKHPDFDWDLSTRRLVQMEGQSPVWITELEKIQAKARGINFFDITDAEDLGSSLRAKSQSFKFPAPNATEKVKPILKTLSTEGPRKNLEHFTSFRTRHYKSETGRQSQLWLKRTIEETTAEWASESLQSRITTSEFKHKWGQHSIITRINGSSTTDTGIIIIGAHQDSTNMWPFLPAPGADDDGSGTVTILESYRALIAADFHPERTIEFHWYSAEEGGLLGSQAVAQDYEKRGVNVFAMTHFDMTAWVKRGTREEVGIMMDNVDPSLTDFNKKIVDLYLDIPWVESKCGYACSDHASWTKAGYPSAITGEGAFENSNNHIHSADDRIDISDEFSFEHMLELAKVAVAFAVELGGVSE